MRLVSFYSGNNQLYTPRANFFIGNVFANERKRPQMRSEDQLLANKSPRLRLVLLFDNNWSSDRIIYGCLSYMLCYGI
jgi:hypothetical protein